MALIDVATLAGRLAQANPPSVIDVRFSLGGPPRHADYLAGHIPGAVFVDLTVDLSGPPGPAGRHPLPDPVALTQVLRRAGVRAGQPVVGYDDGDGMAAARLWWTLRWAGHEEVSVLDGGFAAWTGQGRPVEPGEAVPPAGDFVVRPNQLPVLDATAAAELAATGVLLDARAEIRFRGEQEPVDLVAGHIPGAVNLPVTRLDGPDGRLLPRDELRRAFEAAGLRTDGPRTDGPRTDGPRTDERDGPGTDSLGTDGVGTATGAVGTYCGSGITAAKLALAATEAGFATPALYVGSWSNWITDPDRPVATGPGAGER